MNKIIVPIGYMGSGSSAITGLISEYKNYESSQGEFEYVFLHCPNGLFDLEDKLLIGNNALRSDEALHTFYHEMKKLYSKKYYWVGNYKKIIGEDFLLYVNDFISELIQFKSDYYWYVQEDTNLKMFFQLIFKRLCDIFSFHKIKIKKPLVYNGVWLSYPTEQEFYCSAQKFIYNIMNELGLEKKNIILDQLLLPHNLYRIDHYFKDDLYCFVIDRDPRDVYIINKYIWPNRNEVVPYATEPYAFCKQYRRIRAQEKKTDSNKVYRFHFEDLIYKYDVTVSEIEKILSLESEDHINKNKSFNPSVSINNTQLFLNPKYRDEIEIIEKELRDFLYDFPYQRVSEEEKVF